MNSGQVYVDPDAIDEARRALDGFLCRVHDFDARMGSELARLGITFQEEECDAFCHAFQQIRKSLLRMADDTAVMVSMMGKDAERIRTAQALKPNS